MEVKFLAQKSFSVDIDSFSFTIVWNHGKLPNKWAVVIYDESISIIELFKGEEENNTFDNVEGAVFEGLREGHKYITTFKNIIEKDSYKELVNTIKGIKVSDVINGDNTKDNVRRDIFNLINIDLAKLSLNELGKVYKFIRTKIIARL
jgi:hypothetical protein